MSPDNSASLSRNETWASSHPVTFLPEFLPQLFSALCRAPSLLLQFLVYGTGIYLPWPWLSHMWCVCVYLFFFFFEGTQVLYVARVLNFQSSYLSSVLSHTPPRWLHDALSSGHTICDHGSFLSDPQFPLLRRRTGVEPGTWTTALYCCPLEGQPEGIPSG